MTERQRRTPRQARAASTVDAIFEATFQLLEASGPESLTTNRIAERAGVSVGTLYQYFGGKQAILASMAQRRAEAVRNAIAQTVIAQPGLGAMRSVVHALMNGFEGAPATRMAMMDALFGHGGDAILAEHHLSFLAAIAGKAALDFDLTRETAFVLTHTVVSLLRAAAAEPQLALDPVALEDELVRLMTAYVAALSSAGQAD